MIIYAQGEQWIAFTDAGTRRIERFARLDTPATVVWQPAQTAVGLASFEGDARHAGVLIERRLRTEGAIETDKKIFLHHVESVGLTYQALYSTASLDEWQRMQHWASTQEQHCAWMLATTLAWSMVGPDTPVVLHTENAFQFFGLSGGRIVQANTLAFGTDDASLSYAARTLGERIRNELKPGLVHASSGPPTVRWACMAALGDAVAYDRVMDAFRETSGLPMVSEDAAGHDGKVGPRHFHGRAGARRNPRFRLPSWPSAVSCLVDQRRSIVRRERYRISSLPHARSSRARGGQDSLPGIDVRAIARHGRFLPGRGRPKDRDFQ